MLERDSLIRELEALLAALTARQLYRRRRDDIDVRHVALQPETWALRYDLGRVGEEQECVLIQLDLPGTEDGHRVVCSCGHPRDGLCDHGVHCLQHSIELLADPDGDLWSQICQAWHEHGWQHALHTLDELTREGPAASSRESKATPGDTRPSFRIEVLHDRAQARLRVASFEQVCRDGDTWSVGRRVPWTSWRGRPEWLASPVGRLLVPHLERIVGSDLPRKADSAYLPIDTGALLLALRGAPHVYWSDAPKTRVAVRKGHLRAQLQQVRGGASLTLSFDEHPLAGQRLVPLESGRIAWACRSANTVWLSQPMAPALSRFLRLCASLDTPIGAAQHGRLLVGLRELCVDQDDDFLAVDAALEGETQAAPSHLILGLRLRPELGLEVTLRVRPHPHAADFVPGQGAARLTLHDGPRVFTVLRTMGEETEAALHVMHELGLDSDGAFVEPNHCRWCIAEPSATAALVAMIPTLTQPVQIEWSGPPLRVHGPIDSEHLHLRIVRKRAWFSIDGEATVGETRLSLGELFKLADASVRLKEVAPGEWVHVSAQVLAHVSRLRAMTFNRAGEHALSDAAPLVFADLFDANIDIAAAKEWDERRAAMLEARHAEPVSIPSSLTATLRGYQQDGFRWMVRLSQWGFGACLADDMGLGKTVQALALMLSRASLGPCLVVAPSGVVSNWLAEGRRFAPALSFATGSRRRAGEETPPSGPHHVLVVSYGFLQRHAWWLAQVEWSTAVFDEAQYIKNPATKTARAARQLPAKWSLALTGTPLENRLTDLWSLFRVLNPGVLGSLETFHARFISPIERHGDLDRRATLARLVSPFILRREKKAVLPELPPCTDMTRYAVLSSFERERYEALRQRIVTSLETGTGKDRQLRVLAALTQLRQAACHLGLVDGNYRGDSAKLRVLLELWGNLHERRHSLLVFSQFTRFLDLIETALGERTDQIARIDGQTSTRDRDRTVEAFQAGERRVLLISLRAGGTGLNLTAADYVVHMDPWWNPAVEAQATGRAHRIGQTKPVTAYRVVTRHTVEEKILAMHDDKRELIDGVLAGTSQIGRLDTEELMALIRDGR